MIYVPIKTRFGIFTLSATEKGLCRLLFPSESRGSKLKKQARSVRNPHIAKVSRLLAAYLEGKKVSFSGLLIDWTGFTRFEKKVLRKLARVDYGKTLSYGDLARKTGNHRASRAVGNTMRKNRLPIILPCHRVIASGGALGGYGKGIGWKKRLLRLEGCCPGH